MGEGRNVGHTMPITGGVWCLQQTKPKNIRQNGKRRKMVLSSKDTFNFGARAVGPSDDKAEGEGGRERGREEERERE